MIPALKPNGEHMAIRLESLSAAERRDLAAKLAAFEEKDAQLTRLVGAFKADLEEAGFSVAAAAALLAAPKSRSAGKKAGSGVDRDGKRPMPGVTYTDSATGATWTKAKNGKGAPKKEFVALVASGRTWASLEGRSLPLHKAAVKAAAKKVKKTAS